MKNPFAPSTWDKPQGTGLELAPKPRTESNAFERQIQLMQRRCTSCDELIADGEDHYLVNEKPWCTACARREVGYAVGEPGWIVTGAVKVGLAIWAGLLVAKVAGSGIFAVAVAAALFGGAGRGRRAWRRAQSRGGDGLVGALVDGVVGGAPAPVVQRVRGAAAALPPPHRDDG